MATDKWTADMVFDRIRARFPSPAFVLLPQVRSRTGAYAAGTADALAISVWPSRGLYFVGIEIKVSRHDWRRELANPNKADCIQRYCRHWYVAAPQGIIPTDEVPPTWGLIECKGRSTTVAKNAPTLDAVPPDATFVCSVLRSANNGMVSRGDMAAEIEKRVAEQMKWENSQHDDLKNAVAEFEEASGVKLKETWRFGDIGEAVRTVTATRWDDPRKQLARLRERVVSILDNVDEALGIDKTKLA
jgi:hypothetical protein